MHMPHSSQAKFAGLVRDDHRLHAARANAERFHVHAFIAYAHAAETENAARRVVIDRFDHFSSG